MYFSKLILNVSNFQHRCSLLILLTTDAKQWNKTSAVTWETVHEPIVVVVFRPNQSSSALFVHQPQASQK